MFRMRVLGIPLIVGAIWSATVVSPARADSPSKPRFEGLSNEEAWKRLPRTTPALPAWSQVLAGALPRTTAAMLELDHLHRVHNPLGPVLYHKLRWVAAQANRCAYSRRYAEVGLRAAGLKDDDLKKLAGDWRDSPRAARCVMAFARKLTLAAHTVTDDEVVELLGYFGPEKVVAMVHTLAYANFQDRLFLVLGVAVEAGGPLPPLAARPDPRGQLEVLPPQRPPWKEVLTFKADAQGTRPDWLVHSYADLQKLLDRQKGRKSRIPLPDKKGPRIVWSQVSLGYEPKLTRAWFDCMGTFQREAALNQVFANSLFWVITRSTECFY